MVRDEIRAHFGTPEAKLHVIYNGIDLEAFHPRLREAYRSTMRQKLGIPQDAPMHIHVGAGSKEGRVSPDRSARPLPAA